MKHVVIFLALAACGGNVATPIDAAVDAGDELDDAPAWRCYAPAFPFKVFACDEPGVSCSCPDACTVSFADAGAGECKP